MRAKGTRSFPLQSRPVPRVERQSFGNPMGSFPRGRSPRGYPEPIELLRRGILARISRGKRPAREKVPRVGSTLINWFERPPLYGHPIDFDHLGHHKRGPILLNFCFPLWKVISKVSTLTDWKGLRITIRTKMHQECQSRRS